MSVIEVERRGPVAILRLNRPDKLNALGAPDDGIEIRDACDAVNADLGVRCVVLTGAGKAFSAGGDLKVMQDAAGPFSGSVLEVRRHYQRAIHLATRALYGLDVPLIAAVNGAAIGLGCDIACLADIRMASERAVFGATFLKVGLVPGDGGSWLLPRVIGMSRAAELLFTGKTIDAATAERWGLVGRVTAAEALLDEALALAEQIAQLPPHGLRMGKALLRQSATSSYDAALDTAVLAQVLSHSTDDHREGVAAMLERRAPSFGGR